MLFRSIGLDFVPDPDEVHDIYTVRFQPSGDNIEVKMTVVVDWDEEIPTYMTITKILEKEFIEHEYNPY